MVGFGSIDETEFPISLQLGKSPHIPPAALIQTVLQCAWAPASSDFVLFPLSHQPTPGVSVWKPWVRITCHRNRALAMLSTVFFFCILPPLQQKFFPREAVSDQFYTTWFYSCFLVYSRNLAQNRTLFCLLVFTAVYLDSLEDDDKIRTGVQAGSPWKSALRRRSNRYTQEALFPETKQLDRSLEGGLHLSLQEPLCVLKDLAPPENYMSASSKSHNLTFSVILPLRFKSNLLA